MKRLEIILDEKRLNGKGENSCSTQELPWKDDGLWRCDPHSWPERSLHKKHTGCLVSIFTFFSLCLLYLFVSFEPSLVHFLFLHIYHPSNCDVAILTLDQSVRFTKKHTGGFLTDVEFVKCFTRPRFQSFLILPEENA